jgi:hypothetical protein
LPLTMGRNAPNACPSLTACFVRIDALLRYAGRGGQRGTFLKTTDDRYLLKYLPKSEFWAFHEHAPTYFMFVSNTPTLPSVLCKILGAVHVE